MFLKRTSSKTKKGLSAFILACLMSVSSGVFAADTATTSTTSTTATTTTSTAQTCPLAKDYASSKIPSVGAPRVINCNLLIHPKVIPNTDLYSKYSDLNIIYQGYFTKVVKSNKGDKFLYVWKVNGRQGYFVTDTNGRVITNDTYKSTMPPSSAYFNLKGYAVSRRVTYLDSDSGLPTTLTGASIGCSTCSGPKATIFIRDMNDSENVPNFQYQSKSTQNGYTYYLFDTKTVTKIEKLSATQLRYTINLVDSEFTVTLDTDGNIISIDGN